MAELVLQDRILRHEGGQGKHVFPSSADQKQDWQPYPFIHTFLKVLII